MQLVHDYPYGEGQGVDGDFESLDYSYAQMPAAGHSASLGERKLWCAVIEQAFVDIGAIAATRPTEAEKDNAMPAYALPRDGRDRDEAERWLLRDESDFTRACMLAGVSPGIIRRAAQMFFAMRQGER